MKTKRILAALLALGLGCGFAARARADDAGPSDAPTVSSPAGLDDRVDALEKELKDVQADEAKSAGFKGSPSIPGFGGFGFYSNNGLYGVQIGGFLQDDSRTYGFDGLNTSKGLTSPLVNEFLDARARLLVDGYLGSRVHVRYQEDFSNNGADSGVTGATSAIGGDGALLIDAYGEVKLFPWTQVRVGQFPVPLDIERWRVPDKEDFIQLGYTAGMVIDRSQGALLEFADPKQLFYLGAGAVDGDTDSGSTPVVQAYNSDKDAVAKLFIQPFNRMESGMLGDLGFGVAGTAGNHTMAPELGYKSLGQQVIVAPTAGNVAASVTDGAGYRVVPQAYWYWDNFSLLGEYVHETEDYRFTSTLQNEITTSEAWQVQGGWVLTGEHPSYKGLSLGEASHACGAVELVGRAQGADFDEGALTAYNAAGTAVSSKGLLDPESSVSGLTSWSLGLNYVPVSGVELMVDWDRTVFTDGGANAPLVAGRPTAAFVTANRPTEELLQTRVQFAF